MLAAELNCERDEDGAGEPIASQQSVMARIFFIFVIRQRHQNFACVLVGEALWTHVLQRFKIGCSLEVLSWDVVSWYDRYPVAGAQAIFDSLSKNPFEESYKQMMKTRSRFIGVLGTRQLSADSQDKAIASKAEKYHEKQRSSIQKDHV